MYLEIMCFILKLVYHVSLEKNTVIKELDLS